MNYSVQFKNYLTSLNRPNVTVKNYISDINHFIRWFESEFQSSFSPDLVTLETIEYYRKTNTSNLSASSIERHISSLRKFFNFLKLEGHISYCPFEQSNNRTIEQSDPWKLKAFKDFLYVYNSSSLTIKNYITDIKQFLKWAQEVTRVKDAWKIEDQDIFKKLNSGLLEEYKNRLAKLGFNGVGFSPRSINRKLSSIRKYLKWAKGEGLIPENSDVTQYSRISDGQSIRISESPTFRKSGSPSIPSVPNYSPFPPFRLVQKTLRGGGLLFDRILTNPLASIITSVQYLIWKLKGRPVFESRKWGLRAIGSIRNFPKAFYAPLSISTKYFSLPKKLLHHLKYTRPKWYKIYHSYTISHYFHLAILVIFMSAIGFTVYDSFFQKPPTQEVLGFANPQIPPRILSFQGRLTDSSDNPITTSTRLRFALYDSSTGTGSALLWQEVNTVTPDTDGVFSALLGNGTTMSQSLFAERAGLWLGVTVGQTPELTPRQRLATVAYAQNADNLQGLPPITQSGAGTTNVVLALNSSGNLSIGGSATPTFEATGGKFTLSGKVLTLSTLAGSNSNIELKPDGIGKIDLQEPLQNTSNNNNIASARGSVEVDDLFSILATSSGQSAFTVNQNDVGPIISASSSGTAKFTLSNAGAGTFADDLAINGGDLTTTATTFNLLNATATTLNIGGAATTLSIGASTGTATVNNALAVTGDTTLTGDLAVNGGDITTTAATFNLVNAATTVNLGSTAVTRTINIGTGTNVDTINLGTGGTGVDVIRIGSSVADLALTDANWSITTAGLITTASDLAVNGGDITTTATTFNIDVANTGSVLFRDGTNTLLTIADSGTVGNVTVSGTLTSSGAFTASSTISAGGNLTFSTDNSFDIGASGATRPRTLYMGTSILVGAPTGGDKGAGTINVATDIYKNNTAYTNPDYAFEKYFTGQIVKFANNSGASDYPGLLPLSEVETFAKQNWQLPRVGARQGIFDRGDIILEKMEEAYLYLFELNRRIASLEEKSCTQIQSSTDFGLVKTNCTKTTIEKLKDYVISRAKTEAELITSGAFVVKNSLGETVIGAQVLASAVIGQLRAGLVQAEEIVSPLASIDQIRTNVISPLASDKIVIKLEDKTPQNYATAKIGVKPSLEIQNSSGSAVANIDDQGNVYTEGTITARSASFSGTLNSFGLVSESASISGTLRTKNLIAENIESLEVKVASLSGLAARIVKGSGQTSTQTDNLQPINIASYSAQLAYVDTLQAQVGTFMQGLFAVGPSSFSDATVFGQLSIGTTLTLAENSINVLGSDLEIQPLARGGISFLAGKVRIDASGNLSTSVNLTVKGTLFANLLSPIPNSDLVIRLGEKGKDASMVNGLSQEFRIETASGSAVLSINNKGDLTSSGSARFTDILAKTFLIVRSAQADTSLNETIASSSAGFATITTGQVERTIITPFVKENSLIYLTPTSDTQGKTPYIARQTLENPALGTKASFTIGIPQPVNEDIKINWWIVN